MIFISDEAIILLFFYIFVIFSISIYLKSAQK